MTSPLFSGQFSPMVGSFQSITLTNTSAVKLTLPTGTNGLPKYALIQAVTNAVNWRDDGVAPTATLGSGMILPVSEDPLGFAGDLATLQFISSSASGSTLLVSYYY